MRGVFVPKLNGGIPPQFRTYIRRSECEIFLPLAGAKHRATHAKFNNIPLPRMECMTDSRKRKLVHLLFAAEVGLLRARAFHTYFFKSIYLFLFFVDTMGIGTRAKCWDGAEAVGTRVKCKQNAKGSKLISFVIHLAATVVQGAAVERRVFAYVFIVLLILHPPHRR